MKKLLLVAAAAAFVGIPAAWGTVPPSGSSTGTGRVFLPNPVADLQDQSLTSMPDLAQRLVATAQQLYGSKVAAKVRAAFEARGIL